MAYIRTPLAIVRHSRHCRTTPRCIVISLAACFFLFNYLAYHTLHSIDPLSSSSLDSPDSHLSAAPFTDPSAASDSRGTTQSSFQRTPDWFAHWIRWRGLDTRLADHFSDSPRFDIVYTWVNGSDPDLQQSRRELQGRSPLFSQVGAGDAKAIDAATTKRFRDMDELRYSIRSIAENAKGLHRQIYLLVTEVGPGRGQSPEWLDLSQDNWILHPISHRAIFDNSSHLPTFNSLAIESQIHHLPGLTDIFLYMNDDVFVGTTLLPSDVWTPLYGFVFHMEGSLLVPPTIRPTESNPTNVGEWSSLQYSNYLLSQRFGPRHRAYIAHVAHVLSVPMLEEIQKEWSIEFDQTSSHRFRGEGDARDIQVSFFMAHYILEKLRETQLESYWQYRLDENQDTVLDWKEREKLIHLVQSWNRNQQQPDQYRERHGRGTMLEGHAEVLRRIGMPLSGSTVYQLAGLDGYPFLLNGGGDTSRTIPLTPFQDSEGKQHQPQIPYMQYERPQKRTCQLDLAFCFGSDFLNPQLAAVIPSTQSRAIFHRLAFQEFHCGDCLLEILMQHRDTGMGAWMPQDETSKAFKDVASKVAKYNYVLGTSDYSFMALQGAEGSQKELDALMQQRNKTFFCINDDFADDPTLQNQIHRIFRTFLNQRFPTSSPWEKP